MWRNLIKTFERSLVLNSQQIFLKNTYQKSQCIYNNFPVRTFSCSALLRNTETGATSTTGFNECDTDYIVPYNPEYEKQGSVQQLIDTLSRRFRLSEEDIEHIMNDQVVLRNIRQKSLIDILDMLCAEGVKKRNFVEYPWVITLDKSKLQTKINFT